MSFPGLLYTPLLGGGAAALAVAGCVSPRGKDTPLTPLKRGNIVCQS